MFRHKGIVENCLKELIKDYENSMRVALLDYIMLDPKERERLNIQTYPIKYPVLNIRSPVPWHNSKVVSEHIMSYNYFCGFPVIIALSTIWERYVCILFYVSILMFENCLKYCLSRIMTNETKDLE